MIRRPLVTTDPTHEGAEQPMSDDDTYVGTAEDLADIRAQGFRDGYDRAIANLRDEARLLEFMKANDDALYLEDHELFARYLEAVKDQP